LFQEQLWRLSSIDSQLLAQVLQKMKLDYTITDANYDNSVF